MISYSPPLFLVDFGAFRPDLDPDLNGDLNGGERTSDPVLDLII